MFFKIIITTFLFLGTYFSYNDNSGEIKKDYSREMEMIQPLHWDGEAKENVGIFPKEVEPYILAENGGHIIMNFATEPMSLLVIIDENGKKIETPQEIHQTAKAYVLLDIFQGKDWAGKYVIADVCNTEKCVWKLPENWNGYEKIGSTEIATGAIQKVELIDNILTIFWDKKNAKIPLILGTK